MFFYMRDKDALVLSRLGWSDLYVCKGSFVFDILNLDTSSSTTMLLQRSAIALSRRAVVTAPTVAQRNFSLIPAYFRSKILCNDVELFRSLFLGCFS